MPFEFKTTAARLYRDLARDVPEWGRDDRAACIGNAAHESNGFRTLQEKNPVVVGSKGGWGLFQWTGPRRRAFFAWAKERGFAPDSYEANYGFLLFELRTSEPKAIGATRKAQGLAAKVEAFELAFERAGIKHYPSRLEWARKVLAATGGATAPAKPAPEIEAVIPPPPKPLVKSKTIWAQILGYATGSGATLLAGLNGLDWKVLLVLIVAGTFAGLVIHERMQKG